MLRSTHHSSFCPCLITPVLSLPISMGRALQRGAGPPCCVLFIRDADVEGDETLQAHTLTSALWGDVLRRAHPLNVLLIRMGVTTEERGIRSSHFPLFVSIFVSLFLCQVSAFSTWEKELHKIVFDPRYLLLNPKERKQVNARCSKLHTVMHLETHIHSSLHI